jgi:hypothetical protein
MVHGRTLKNSVNGRFLQPEQIIEKNEEGKAAGRPFSQIRKHNNGR